MTPTTDTTPAAKTTQSPLSRDEVKRMLRDAAFVLHMTRRVKSQIAAERPEAAKPVAPRRPEMPAGLGV